MRCPNCSKEIRDSAVFCGYCGKPVPKSPSPAAPPARKPVRPPAPGQPKKKRAGLIVALCILGFLVIAGGVLAFLGFHGDIDIGEIFSPARQENTSRDRDEDEDDGDEDDRRGRDKDKEKDDASDADEDRDKDKDKGKDKEKDEDKDEGKDEAGDRDEGEEATRLLNSFLYADIAVCVVDRMQLWPDAGEKPFADAASRLYRHTDLSLLVFTVDDAGGDIAAFTDNSVRDWRWNNADAGPLLDEVVAITFDASRQSCYMARYTDAAHVYDLDGLTGFVSSFIAGGDYETAVVYLLKNAKEKEPEYLLPNSGTEYLTRDDLSGLTWEECCFARNEIYARHGRIFATREIRAYFESRSWYDGVIAGADFDANVTYYLSDVERANVKLIREYENEIWGGSYY